MKQYTQFTQIQYFYLVLEFLETPSSSKKFPGKLTNQK